MAQNVKPIDLRALRQVIEGAPANGDAAVVSRRWLIQVERELAAARGHRPQAHA